MIVSTDHEIIAPKSDHPGTQQMNNLYQISSITSYENFKNRFSQKDMVTVIEDEICTVKHNDKVVAVLDGNVKEYLLKNW